MSFPRFPDWLIYLAIVLAIGIVAAGRRERTDAPQPLGPVPGAAAMPLDPALPFDRAQIVRTPAGSTGAVGTAFSVGAKGVWLTARSVAQACRRPVLMVAEGRGLEAKVDIVEDSGIAVLTTAGGAPPLGPARGKSVKVSARGFVPGFPNGSAGEAAARLTGPADLAPAHRGGPHLKVLAWAQTGRTEGLSASLEGLAGAPLLDAQGRVAGVMLADAPRRGVIYSTGPEAVALAIASARETASTATPGAVTVQNYFRIADRLRLSLSVVEVKCLG